MKAIRVAALVCAAALTTAAPAGAETVLRLNSILPAGHFISKDGWGWWAREVESRTKGRVKVEFSTKALGALPRAYDLVRDGVADVSWGVQGYTPGRFVSAEIVDLPFLGTSGEALSVAYWRTYKKHFEKIGEYKDVHLLAVHTHGPGDIVTGDAKVAKMEDLKGRKIRILNRTTGQILDMYGGAPVREPMPMLGQLLSKGVVDGSFSTADGVDSFKLGKYIKHWLRFPDGLYNTSFFFIMNKGKWDALSAEDRKAIDGVSGEAFARHMGVLWDKSQERGVALMKSNGTAITEVQGAELAAVKAKLKVLEDEWIKRATEKGIDAKAALAMMRAEAAGYKRP